MQENNHDGDTPVDLKFDPDTLLALREEQQSDGSTRYLVVTDDGVPILDLPPRLSEEEIGQIYRACIRAEWLGSWAARQKALKIMSES
jgi:hypothetical protein